MMNATTRHLLKLTLIVYLPPPICVWAIRSFVVWEFVNPFDTFGRLFAVAWLFFTGYVVLETIKGKHPRAELPVNALFAVAVLSAVTVLVSLSLSSIAELVAIMRRILQ